MKKLIEFSVKNKLVIALFMIAWVAWGLYNMKNLNVDAVPDITNNQVQVVTVAPALAPEEVEQFVTYPIEQAVANLQGMQEIRSISRYGLSVVTIVFEENFDIYLARQLVSEAISSVDIPEEYGTPELMPITTGLGEIYQYTLEVKPGYENVYTLTDLREIQDWIVKRQLAGTKGIVEVSSFGGYLKQYEVAVNPDVLRSYDISIEDIQRALENNNQNTGGSYIQQGPYAKYIRAEGLIKNKEEIENIVITVRNGVPILIKDVAEVKIGHPTRYGAMTKDGKGEVVGGITLMLKGGNANKIVKNVKAKIKQIQKNLPEGVVLKPYYDRSELVNRVIATITENLSIAALIVILVLVLLLGSLRSGLIVSSVIPLSLLFAFSLMNIFGVSASVMSLGAIDFGLIVDGAVIILEGILFYLHKNYLNQKITSKELDEAAINSAQTTGKSAVFGVLIILIVYFPILALKGIEGKMFRPLALTISFALLGSLILSITYIPMMSALFLNKKIKLNFSEKIIRRFQKIMIPGLEFGMKNKKLVLTFVLVLFAASLYVFSKLGAEFVPSLEEGDLAMQITLPPGSSLNESIKISTQAEQILLENFPEVKSVISKIGTAEVPTDPMAIEDADVIIVMKPKSQWVSAKNRFEMADKMKEKLSVITGATFDFTQPIQLRFNELLTGAKSDIVIKIYGEDLGVLYDKANEIAQLISGIQGAADIKVEQVAGLPQIIFTYDRQKMAQYGLNVKQLNEIIKSAFAGAYAGVIFEGERRFDLVVRMSEEYRKNIDNIKKLFVKTPNGTTVSLEDIVKIEYREGPMQISRDNTHRRITIGINVRNRDIKSLVDEISEKINKNVELPPGYYITYGGQFENLQAATNRLMIVLPIALGLIFILLYFAFNSIKQALIIYSTIPLSIIGGVFALWIRGLPFSISAGVGFIALFGVSVLNGIVLMNQFNKLKEKGISDINERIKMAVIDMVRPVSLTTLVAALGFIPMAVSNQAGAEVQRPLATVVIGGIVIAAIFSMIVVPILYYYAYVNEDKKNKNNKNNSGSKMIATILFLVMMPFFANSQDSLIISTEQAKEIALKNNPIHKNVFLETEFYQKQKQTAFNLGYTSLDYEYGQINSSMKDYSLSVSQDLGNPLEKVKLNSLYKTKLEQAKYKQTLSEKEICIQVCHSYFDYIFWNRQLDLYQKFQKLYQRSLKIVKARLEAGNATKVEYGILQEKVKTFEWQIKEIKIKEIQALRNFNQLLFSDTIVYIPDTTNFECKGQKLFVFDTSKISSNPYLNLKKYDLQLAQQQINLEKSRLFPSFSVGYFNQQIDGIAGFQGISFSVEMPLFFASQRKNIQMAKIQQQIAQNEFIYTKKQITDEYFLLYTEYQNLLDRKNYYEKQGIPIANDIVKKSQKLYEVGEIDYIQYLQNLSEAFNIHIEYLTTIYQLRHISILLNYYYN